MPRITPTLTVQIADPIKVFGITTAPDASYTDAMCDLVKRDPHMVGLRYDQALDCLMMAPAYGPVDTLKDDATTTGGTWVEAKTRVSKKACVVQNKPVPDEEWEYSCPGGTGTAQVTAVPDGGGIWVVINKSMPIRGGTGTMVATIDADHCYVMATLLADDATTGYRIVWRYGECPRVERTINGTDWIRMGDIPVGDASGMATGKPSSLRFQVLRANGKIAFRATPSNAVNESALTVPDIELIYPLVVTGMNVCAGIAHFPVTFPQYATLYSPERQLLWANSTTPTPVGKGSITGISLTMETTGSTVTQYSAVYTAQSSYHVTPYLTHVTVSIPAIETAPQANPVWTTLTYVLGFDLQQSFIPEQLTVRRAGSVTCRNNPQGTGFGNLGLYSSALGMCAVKVTAGLDVMYDDGSTATLWSATRFIGWLNAESVTSPWEWVSELTDRIEWELDTPLCADVQFDGCCIYWVAKQLAQRAGFTGSQWYEAVSGVSDAWTCDGTTCDPATHYRLGQGTVSNPSFAYTADQSKLDALQDIALKYGMFCGVSHLGKFQFYPFTVSGARASWSPVQIFSSVPTLTAGVPNLNEFVGDLKKHISLKGVRNSTTLIGLDKDWRLFASHQLDSASITGNGTPYQPVNFLGRLRPYVDSSARYYDATATDAWCLAKHTILRQPRMWYDPLECHAQPLQCLNYIGIAANWTMPGDDKFYIGSMQESIQTHADETGAIQTYDMRLYPEIVPYSDGRIIDPDTGGGEEE